MNVRRRKLEHLSRAAATGLCLITFGAGCILVSVLIFPLIRLTSSSAAVTRHRVRECLGFAYRFFLRMGRGTGVISYELHGAERLAGNHHLLVANHPSLIDVLFVGAQLPQVGCIVKDALMQNPFLGLPVRWAGYIPNSTPERLIENCVETLHAGHSLLVFPEGTRSIPGKPLKFKRGAAHIALAAGCDLLPVSIVCHPKAFTKTDVWYRVPRHRPHWRVNIGEPIRLSDLVNPGEPASLSARRITAHLTEYFSAHAALPTTPTIPTAAAAHACARSAATS